MAVKTRRSEQREMILQTVLERKDHPTAEAVFNALHSQAPHLSLGTVYRNLNLLADRGQIRRVPIPGQPDRFDSTLEPHAHFRCASCGRVFDLPLEPGFDPCAAAKACGCRLMGYELVFTGECADCCGAAARH